MPISRRIMLLNLTPDSLLVSHIKLTASFYGTAIEAEQINSLLNYCYQIILGMGSQSTIHYLIMLHFLISNKCSIFWTTDQYNLHSL